jgi:enoyl-CoA hydratase/carnithine racemase
VYGDDTARLCDLAREAVAFELADGLARCLEAVRADPDARVVRVRDSGLLSASSGGGVGGCKSCGADRSGGFR